MAWRRKYRISSFVNTRRSNLASLKIFDFRTIVDLKLQRRWGKNRIVVVEGFLSVFKRLLLLYLEEMAGA